MRILLSRSSKKRLFNFWKDKYGVKSLNKLSKKINIPPRTLSGWRYEKWYLPEKIIPTKIVSTLSIIDKQPDNWGMIKGGKIGGKRSAEIMKTKLGKRRYSEMMSKRGKRVINTIWKRYGKEKLIQMTVKGKIKKREEESKRMEGENESYFTNEEICLNLKDINYTSNDLKKKIIFPNKITSELAEEIGIHLGDGCLSKNRNYFSVKTNKKEDGYMRYLFQLYKKLYNLDLKLMVLPSVVGFEIYSKALCEFKNKVLGLPYGEKIHRIKVPKSILDTKNKEVYYALLRGLFDTDGCICIVKRNNKDYPIISLCIKSKKLILQVNDILKRLGYIPFHNKQSIVLSGIVMFKKWVREIGSNNPKNIKKLRWANSITESTQPCGL